MLTIQTLGAYVPENRLSLGELAESLSLNANEIGVLQKFYGLHTIAKSNSGFEHLIATALQDLLCRSTVDPAKIDLILYTHTAYETEIFPNNLLNRIVRGHGFVNAIAFGIHSNNCASLMTALDVARQYIGKTDAQVIIITADLTFTEIMRHIPNTTVCGAPLQRFEVFWFSKYWSIVFGSQHNGFQVYDDQLQRQPIWFRCKVLN